MSISKSEANWAHMALSSITSKKKKLKLKQKLNICDSFKYEIEAIEFKLLNIAIRQN